MPKIKPLHFEDYSNDDLTFHHDQELESLLLNLRVTNKLKHNGNSYTIGNDHLDVSIKCSRIEDTINKGQTLKIINASLSSYAGSWNPHTKISHTMIDRTTLYTLLKLLS